MRDERGMTLPELLVTMFVLSVLSALVLGLVAAFSGTFIRDRASSGSTMTASTGMKELSRVVRGGTPLQLTSGAVASAAFVEARADRLTLYTYVDTDGDAPRPMRVRFQLDAQRRVVETRWLATTGAAPWTFVPTGSPSTQRPILRQVVTPAPGCDQGLFAYLDADRNPITIGSSGATSAQLDTIAAVSICYAVQDVDGRADPVTIKNVVGMPNIGGSAL